MTDKILKKILLAIVFLSCFTYAGTLDLGIRVFPAELMYITCLIPLFIFTRNIKLYKTDQIIIFLGSLFILIHFFSLIKVIFTYNPIQINLAVSEFIRAFLAFSIFIVIIVLVKNRIVKVEQLIRTFINSALLVSIYAIYQVVSVKVLGYYIPVIPNSSDVPNMNGRGVGTFMEGGYAVVFLGIGYFLLIGYKKNIETKMKYISYSTILLIGILSTQSTSGIAAMVMCMFIYMFLNKKNKILYIFSFKFYAILAAFTIVLVLIYNFFNDKLTALFNGLFALSTMSISGFTGGIGDFSAEDRLIKSLKAINMFGDYPIFGVGIRQYAYYYISYPPLGLTEDVNQVVPLNVFSEIAAELGLIGLLIFISLMIYLYFMTRNIGKVIIIYLIINFFTYPTYKMLYIWIIFAIVYLISKKNKNRLGEF